MTDITPLLNKVHCMDALELMAQLPDASVDAIITDLPYGTTACSWDEIIPFEPMWAGVKRVLKPRGVFVTTASQPFTSKLVMSNLAWFKYEWVWEKTVGSNPLLTGWQPFKTHESILVFSTKQPTFYPQYERGMPYVDKQRHSGLKALHKTPGMKKPIVNIGTRIPRSVQEFSNGNNFNLHPTQKPLDLYKYLVLTYTQPGDVVLDFCAGSGTTAVAAATLNRHFIAGDTDAGYCAIARKRLETVTQDMFAVYGGFEVQP